MCQLWDERIENELDLKQHIDSIHVNVETFQMQLIGKMMGMGLMKNIMMMKTLKKKIMVVLGDIYKS